jgi:hypothetical protein
MKRREGFVNVCSLSNNQRIWFPGFFLQKQKPHKIESYLVIMIPFLLVLPCLLKGIIHSNSLFTRNVSLSLSKYWHQSNSSKYAAIVDNAWELPERENLNLRWCPDLNLNKMRCNIQSV